MHRPSRLTAALAFVAAVAGGAPAVAQSPPRIYDLPVAIRDVRKAGEIDLRLRLSVYPDGTVDGTAILDDGEIRDVEGGLTGRRMWLRIPGLHPDDYTGTFAGGRIRLSAALRVDDYVLTNAR